MVLDFSIEEGEGGCSKAMLVGSGEGGTGEGGCRKTMLVGGTREGDMKIIYCNLTFSQPQHALIYPNLGSKKASGVRIDGA